MRSSSPTVGCDSDSFAGKENVHDGGPEWQQLGCSGKASPVSGDRCRANRTNPLSAQRSFSAEDAVRRPAVPDDCRNCSVTAVRVVVRTEGLLGLQRIEVLGERCAWSCAPYSFASGGRNSTSCSAETRITASTSVISCSSSKSSFSLPAGETQNSARQWLSDLLK